MKRARMLTLVAAIGLVASSAYATNGYFSHGYGAYYKALAGAGVAFPLNSLAPATNPAALVYVGERQPSHSQFGHFPTRYAGRSRLHLERHHRI